MNLLTKQQVKDYIHGKPGIRVPCFLKFWVEHPGYWPYCKQTASANDMEILNRFQDDVAVVSPVPANVGKSVLDGHPGYCWYSCEESSEKDGYDNRVALSDWEQLDEFMAHLPDPCIPEILDGAKEKAKGDSRYLIGHFWNFYYERLWMLRGMENALTDFYLYPEEIHRVFQAFTDVYLVYVRRLKEELDCDAIFVTDDLGTQNSLMFNPAVFREFFHPYYKQVIDETHRLGMDFWFHSCGDVSLLMPDLIGLGVDVLHPIQKFAFNRETASKNFGDKICMAPGMDLQQVMPLGTPADIEEEIEKTYRLFGADNRHFIFAMGNMVTQDIPPRNIAHLFEYLENRK